MRIEFEQDLKGKTGMDILKVIVYIKKLLKSNNEHEARIEKLERSLESKGGLTDLIDRIKGLEVIHYKNDHSKPAKPSTNELDSCPFCRGDIHIMECYRGGAGRFWYGQCFDCGMRSKYYASRTEAVEAINTRA